MHIPFDFADEVEDDTLLGDTEDLRVEVLRVIRATKDVVAFAISVIIRIIHNFNQAVVAHAARESWLNDLGFPRLPEFACDPGNRRGVDQLNIVIRLIQIFLHQ